MNSGLLNSLRANAADILKVLSANGVDVSKYQVPLKELEEKRQRKRQKAKEYRERHKSDPAAILYAFIGEKPPKKKTLTAEIGALKEIIEQANAAEIALEKFLQVQKQTENKSASNRRYRERQKLLRSKQNEETAKT